MRSPTQHLRPRSVIFSTFLLAVVLLYGYPLIMLVVGAMRTGQPGTPGSWSLRAFPEAYGSGDTWETFKNSVIFAGAVQIIGITLAFVLAWLVTRTNTPLRKIVTFMMVAAFAIPPLFFAISWGLMTSSGGIMTRILGVNSSGDPVFTAYSWTGLIGVSALKTTSVMYLLLLGPVRAMNRSFEEASRIAGARRLQTMMNINLPMLLPLISGLFILGFVHSLGQLDAPLILGMPADIWVFPTEIYNHLAQTPIRYDVASALALLLVALILVLILMQKRLVGMKDYAGITGKGYVAARQDIGKWKWLGTGLICAYAVIGFILPLAQLAVGSFQSVLGVSGSFTFDNYRALFENDEIVQAIMNTLTVGLIGGFVASCLGLIVSYLAIRGRSWTSSLPDLLVWVVVAVPGLVLALCVSWAYLSLPVLKELFGSIWLVLIALIITVSPVAARAISGAVTQIAVELEESARVSGARPIRMIRSVVLPLVISSFLSGWFITGVVAAGNLDIPILLSSPDSVTVSLLVYDYYTQIGNASLAAALLCLMLLFFVAGIALITVIRLTLRAALRRNSARRATRPTTDSAELTLVKPS